jgi:hypothetical protein
MHARTHARAYKVARKVDRNDDPARIYDPDRTEIDGERCRAQDAARDKRKLHEASRDHLSSRNRDLRTISHVNFLHTRGRISSRVLVLA